MNKPKKTTTERRDPTANVERPAQLQLQNVSEHLIRKAELRAAAEMKRRTDLNESLAKLLIACAPERGSCAEIRAVWADAFLDLEEPYRTRVERWCREHASANTEA